MTTDVQAGQVGDPADTALKARHATMWALGDYASVARELIASLGPVLVEAAGVGPGDRVLDIAAGTGNVAIPAARTGAAVTATDLTPELLEAGRRLASDAGVELTWEVADAEALPFEDGAFDVALSCVGIMFAPHHAAAADQLVRVVRPGGRIGLVSWTPEGFIGQMFATMKPYAAPPPPGASPPPLWGSEQHVRTLLGDRVEEVQAERRMLEVRFGPEGFRDFFKRTYGPTIVTYRGIAEHADKVAALDEALEALDREHTESDGTMRWEYLLVTATRAG